MQFAEVYEKHGVEVVIYYAEDAAADPRDADNLGEMHVVYPGHRLGDCQLPQRSLPEIECPHCEGMGVRGPGDCTRCEGCGRVDPELSEWLGSLGAIAAMPLFVYDHGVLTMRAGRLVPLADGAVWRSDTESAGRFPLEQQGWDTSFVGFIVVTEERVQALCGSGEHYPSAAWLEASLKAEVAEYSLFLQGEVYGYVVAEGTPFMDNVCGLIGFDYAKEEADRAAKAAASALRREETARASWAARDVITVSTD